MIIILSLVGCVTQPDTTISPAGDSTETIEDLRPVPLYKLEKNFEGYKYCIFVFDEEYQSYVEKHEYIFDDFCQIKEKLPHLSDFFYNEYEITFEESDWDIWASYVGNGKVVINKKYWNLKNLDTALAHEIAHSATEGLDLPIWLNEGIAEYSSYRFRGKEDNIHSLYVKDITTLDFYNANFRIRINAYMQSAFIVKKMVERFGDSFIRDLLIEINGKFGRDDGVENKNRVILGAIKKVANNESITMEEIIDPKKFSY